MVISVDSVSSSDLLTQQRTPILPVKTDTEHQVRFSRAAAQAEPLKKLMMGMKLTSLTPQLFTQHGSTAVVRQVGINSEGHSITFRAGPLTTAILPSSKRVLQPAALSDESPTKLTADNLPRGIVNSPELALTGVALGTSGIGYRRGDDGRLYRFGPIKGDKWLPCGENGRNYSHPCTKADQFIYVIADSREIVSLDRPGLWNTKLNYRIDLEVEGEPKKNDTHRIVAFEVLLAPKEDAGEKHPPRNTVALLAPKEDAGKGQPYYLALSAAGRAPVYYELRLEKSGQVVPATPTSTLSTIAGTDEHSLWIVGSDGGIYRHTAQSVDEGNAISCPEKVSLLENFKCARVLGFTHVPVPDSETEKTVLHAFYVDNQGRLSSMFLEQDTWHTGIAFDKAHVFDYRGGLDKSIVISENTVEIDRDGTRLGWVDKFDKERYPALEKGQLCVQDTDGSWKPTPHSGVTALHNDPYAKGKLFALIDPSDRTPPYIAEVMLSEEQNRLQVGPSVTRTLTDSNIKLRKVELAHEHVPIEFAIGPKDKIYYVNDNHEDRLQVYVHDNAAKVTEKQDEKLPRLPSKFEGGAIKHLAVDNFGHLHVQVNHGNDASIWTCNPNAEKPAWKQLDLKNYPKGLTLSRIENTRRGDLLLHFVPTAVPGKSDENRLERYTYRCDQLHQGGRPELTLTAAPATDASQNAGTYARLISNALDKISTNARQAVDTIANSELAYNVLDTIDDNKALRFTTNVIGGVVSGTYNTVTTLGPKTVEKLVHFPTATWGTTTHTFSSLMHKAWGHEQLAPLYFAVKELYVDLNARKSTSSSGAGLAWAIANTKQHHPQIASQAKAFQRRVLNDLHATLKNLASSCSATVPATKSNAANPEHQSDPKIDASNSSLVAALSTYFNASNRSLAVALSTCFNTIYPPQKDDNEPEPPAVSEVRDLLKSMENANLTYPDPKQSASGFRDSDDDYYLQKGHIVHCITALDRLNGDLTMRNGDNRSVPIEDLDRQLARIESKYDNSDITRYINLGFTRLKELEHAVSLRDKIGSRLSNPKSPLFKYTARLVGGADTPTQLRDKLVRFYLDTMRGEQTVIETERGGGLDFFGLAGKFGDQTAEISATQSAKFGLRSTTLPDLMLFSLVRTKGHFKCVGGGVGVSLKGIFRLGTEVHATRISSEAGGVTVALKPETIARFITDMLDPDKSLADVLELGESTEQIRREETSTGATWDSFARIGESIDNEFFDDSFELVNLPRYSLTKTAEIKSESKQEHTVERTNDGSYLQTGSQNTTNTGAGIIGSSNIPFISFFTGPDETSGYISAGNAMFDLGAAPIVEEYKEFTYKCRAEALPEQVGENEWKDLLTEHPILKSLLADKHVESWKAINDSDMPKRLNLLLNLVCSLDASEMSKDSEISKKSAEDRITTLLCHHKLLKAGAKSSRNFEIKMPAAALDSNDPPPPIKTLNEWMEKNPIEAQMIRAGEATITLEMQPSCWHDYLEKTAESSWKSTEEAELYRKELKNYRVKSITIRERVYQGMRTTVNPIMIAVSAEDGASAQTVKGRFEFLYGEEEKIPLFHKESSGLRSNLSIYQHVDQAFATKQMQRVVKMPVNHTLSVQHDPEEEEAKNSSDASPIKGDITTDIVPPIEKNAALTTRRMSSASDKSLMDNSSREPERKRLSLLEGDVNASAHAEDVNVKGTAPIVPSIEIKTPTPKSTIDIRLDTDKDTDKSELNEILSDHADKKLTSAVIVKKESTDSMRSGMNAKATENSVLLEESVDTRQNSLLAASTLDTGLVFDKDKAGLNDNPSSQLDKKLATAAITKNENTSSLSPDMNAKPSKNSVLSEENIDTTRNRLNAPSITPSRKSKDDLVIDSFVVEDDKINSHKSEENSDTSSTGSEKNGLRSWKKQIRKKLQIDKQFGRDLKNRFWNILRTS